ncbi:DNA primase [Thiomonas sp. X19]|uniref:DNA primase n=1 Tax=Thiomonas sp. X19 TaxID=1050370 RepID=UPI000B6B8957|nr:DNA primase [Thiomonas sp. X19]SCC94896.1 DNA primase [Thiomonas sp. X19]
MSLIPQDFIQELLGRTDIVEVVGRSVQLKKAGTNHKGLCPFHSEKSPSFTVSSSKQFYHCFGCGAHGTAIGFLMDHLGLTFPDAVRELASQAGMTVPEAPQDPQQAQHVREQRSLKQSLQDVLEQANRFYRDQLRDSKRAVSYLKGRGLSGPIAGHFGLGYAPDDWQGLARVFPNYEADPLVQAGLVVARDDQGETIEPGALEGQAVTRRYDRLRDRITFPIRNTQGELIGFGGRILDQGEPKYLNSPETLLFHKGEELYGLFEGRAAIQRQGYALVVEGYLDVIALAQHGVGNAVATLGTACTAEHVKKLFRHCGQIVFSFDGDTAGQKAAVRALEAALPALGDERSVKFLFLPPEHDPDTFVREHGADAFEREVGRAQPLSVFLLDTLGSGLAMSTAEGRAQAIARARPLLALLPDSALKSQILGEFAKRVEMPLAELRPALALPERHAGTGKATRQENERRPERRSSMATQRASRLAGLRTDHAQTAMRILLAQPELWSTLSSSQHELLMQDGSSTQALASWLEAQLDAYPDLSASALWEGLRLAGLLDQVQSMGAADGLDAEPASVQQDLMGALRWVELERIRQRQEELSRDGLIDEASRAEFRSLLSRRRELG